MKISLKNCVHFKNWKQNKYKYTKYELRVIVILSFLLYRYLPYYIVLFSSKYLTNKLTIIVICNLPFIYFFIFWLYRGVCSIFFTLFPLPSFILFLFQYSRCTYFEYKRLRSWADIVTRHSKRAFYSFNWTRKLNESDSSGRARLEIFSGFKLSNFYCSKMYSCIAFLRCLRLFIVGRILKRTENCSLINTVEHKL